jgi:hypothetical protein
MLPALPRQRTPEGRTERLPRNAPTASVLFSGNVRARLVG